MRITLAVTFAAITLATTVAAQTQIKAFSGEKDRLSSTVFVAELNGQEFVGLKGAVSINYTGPEWNDRYDAMLAKNELKGNQRLGKNWWTSFDTTMAVEIGTTKIAPGAYYLGLQIDATGNFQLLVIDAKQAMTSGWAPNMPAPWKTDIKAPMSLAKNSLKETAEKMAIEITADEKNAATGKLSIRWGKHELSAPVKFHFDAAKDAAGKKEEAKK